MQTLVHKVQLLLIGLVLAACQPIQAPPTVPAPDESADIVRVLFIGDSLSMYLEELFPKLVASTDSPPTVEVTLLWEGGATLDEHMDDRYTIEEVTSGDWDAVVLQEDTAGEWWRINEFPANAEEFDAIIRHTGAQTVLFMPWPWARQTKPTTADIEAIFRDVGTELDVTVSPVALAWQRALQARPDLQLYSDDVHASPLGAYLTACVLYATLFERSPVGAGYRLDVDNRFAYTWAIPERWLLSDADAEFLQQVAWETVSEYQTQP